MKCFKDDEIAAVKLAIKCEIRKNKKVSSATLDAVLEKIDHFKCPDKSTISVSEISKLPLAERIKYAKMLK